VRGLRPCASVGLRGAQSQGAKRGEQAFWKAPRFWGKNVSSICAIDSGGVKPSMSVGGVGSKAFEVYVERFLVPALRRGRMVVMDNLCVQESERGERRIEATGGAPSRDHRARHPRILRRLRIPSTFGSRWEIALGAPKQPQPCVMPRDHVAYGPMLQWPIDRAYKDCAW
jgi:hypothetical protein